MLKRLLAVPIGLLCLSLFLAGKPAGAVAEADDDVTVPEGAEVLARGPVHEAYAEPSTPRPEAPPAVGKAPPELIEEAPPEEKPDGDNVVWIPGYWGYDEDEKDFLWVSGFWRNAPPGRTWIPGTWQKVGAGHQWSAGYWSTLTDTSDGAEDVEYLPPPPAASLIERGPSTPAPMGVSSSYVPGIWIFRETRYVWQPGYWVGHRPGWVWTPSCYKWSPAGHIFVRGFWDRPLHDRGLLCAPVRFAPRLLRDRAFVWRPRHIVQPDFLLGALFVRPTTRQYFFGDYFDKRYVTRGYTPWFDYRMSRAAVGYDTNYNYYRNAYAKHSTWDTGLRRLYTERYAGTVDRPPRTLVQQTKVVNNFTTKKVTNVVVHKNVNITNIQNVNALAPIRRVNKTQVTGLSSLAGIKAADVRTAPVARQIRTETVSKERIVAERKAATRYQAVAKERRTVESKYVAKTDTATKFDAPRRAKIVLPKGTPPAPRVKTAARPPDAPERPKVVVKPATPPGPPVRPAPPAPKDTTPPPPKDTKPPRPPKDTRPPEPIKPPPPPPKDVKPPEPPKPPPPKDTKPPRPKDTKPPKPADPPKPPSPPPPKDTKPADPPKPPRPTPPPPPPKDTKPPRPADPPRPPKDTKPPPPPAPPTPKPPPAPPKDVKPPPPPPPGPKPPPPAPKTPPPAPPKDVKPPSPPPAPPPTPPKDVKPPSPPPKPPAPPPPAPPKDRKDKKDKG